jgi:hypothetical protein
VAQLRRMSGRRVVFQTAVAVCAPDTGFEQAGAGAGAACSFRR